jgi:hypothetical protein
MFDCITLYSCGIQGQRATWPLTQWPGDATAARHPPAATGHQGMEAEQSIRPVAIKQILFVMDYYDLYWMTIHTTYTSI